MVLLILCTAVLASLYGCTGTNDERYYFDTEFFKCVSVSKDSDTTAVIGLTDKGKEQEILVFPEKLNGYTVDQIGCSYYTTSIGYSYVKTHTVDVSTAKKIYLLSPLNVSKKSYVTGFSQCEQIVVIDGVENCLIWHTLPRRREYPTGELPAIVLSESNYLTFSEMIDNMGYKENIFVANINFHYNQHDDFLFFIDSYNENNLYIEPIFTEFTETDKVLFRGWYTEQDCINEWNRQYPSSQEETLDLYAKWNNN